MRGTSRHPSANLDRLALTFRVRQLSDSNFINELEAALADTGLDPRTLQLELTESIILEQAENVRACYWNAYERWVSGSRSTISAPAIRR